LTRQRIKTALTTSAKPKLERQARRLTRQQKQLEQELMRTDDTPVKLTASRGRTLKQTDIKNIQPQTDTQEDVFDEFSEASALVLHGSAGTGKTFIAMYLALLDVMDPESTYDRLVILRSCAPTRDIGFLPGTAEEKLEMYEAPYEEICAELTGRKDAYAKLKDMGLVEFASTSFLRGVTFNNAIVIADEFQNTTFQEASTVITRVGKNTKLVVVGDSRQDDLTKNKNDVSGFRDFLDVSYTMPEFRHFRFLPEDIVRSGLVKAWIIACEKKGL